MVKTHFEIKEPIQLQIGRTYIKGSLISFEDLINFQKRRQIEKNKTELQKIKESFEDKVIKKDNKYEPLETEYIEKESDKKEENNNMDIEES